jgi:hypothetical protein
LKGKRNKDEFELKQEQINDLKQLENSGFIVLYYGDEIHFRLTPNARKLILRVWIVCRVRVLGCVNTSITAISHSLKSIEILCLSPNTLISFPVVKVS